MGNKTSICVEDDVSLYTPEQMAQKSQIETQFVKEYPKLAKKVNADSMIVTNNTLPDNPIVFINDFFEKLTLYPREEIINRNCRFLQGEGTDRNTVKKVRQAIDQGESLKVEILNYRKDGKPFWNKFLMLPLHCDPTKPSFPTHFVAIQRDITFKVQKKKSLQEWTVKETCKWLSFLQLGIYSKVFQQAHIDGQALITLTKETLQDLGITDMAHIELLLASKRDLEADAEYCNTDIAVKYYFGSEVVLVTIPRAQCTFERVRNTFAQLFSMPLRDRNFTLSIDSQFKDKLTSEEDMKELIQRMEGRTIRLFASALERRDSGSMNHIDLFEQVMNSPSHRNSFQKHLSKLFCDEMLIFLNEVEEFKKACANHPTTPTTVSPNKPPFSAALGKKKSNSSLSSPFSSPVVSTASGNDGNQTLSQRLQALYAKFICEESPYALNLPSPIRQSLLMQCCPPTTTTVEMSAEKMAAVFNPAISHITNLLSADLFQRFVSSPDGKKFMSEEVLVTSLN